MPESNADDRVVELEQTLRELLDNFDAGPEGTTIESMDGLVFVSPDVEDVVARATDVLERGE